MVKLPGGGTVGLTDGLMVKLPGGGTVGLTGGLMVKLPGPGGSTGGGVAVGDIFSSKMQIMIGN